jgi:hypothetical protein
MARRPTTRAHPSCEGGTQPSDDCALTWHTSRPIQERVCPIVARLSAIVEGGRIDPEGLSGNERRDRAMFAGQATTRRSLVHDRGSRGGKRSSSTRHRRTIARERRRFTRHRATLARKRAECVRNRPLSREGSWLPCARMPKGRPEPTLVWSRVSLEGSPIFEVDAHANARRQHTRFRPPALAW